MLYNDGIKRTERHGGMVLEMIWKKTGLTREDAQDQNKWRRKVKVNSGSPGKWPLKQCMHAITRH